MAGNDERPMAGVWAQPFRDEGVCQMHRNGDKCLSGGKPAGLWQVAWDDGVVMELCTRCMASLVFEE